MRKIQFRGLRKSDGQWFIGDLIRDTSEFNRTCDKAYILPYWDKLNAPISVAKETIGQYTGLKDKSGAEIYEGDIVQYIDGEYSFQAVVELDYWKWYLKGIDPVDNFDIDDYTDKDRTDLEVIGNIYEKSELN